MNFHEIAENPALNSSALNFQNELLSIFEGGTRRRGGPPRLILPIAKYPVFEFHENGDVTFTVSVQDVKKVEVGGRLDQGWDDGRHELEYQGNGVFRSTISGILPGYHFIQYYFDDRPVLYDRAPMGYGYGFYANAIDVPDPELDFYLLKDVPHGAVRYETYFSEYTGTTRCCWVYTPPSYDTSPDKYYPTFYIQHGGGENETGWFWQGKINYIADNLIAEGKCEEMLIVANFGMLEPKTGKQDVIIPDMGPMLVDDCIPFIEKRFRAKQGKAYRAMAGLSMGSFQTQYACFGRPEAFDYIGIFSGNTGVHLPGTPDRLGALTAKNWDMTLEEVEAFNNEHKLLFYGKGLREGADEQKKEIEYLHNLGVKCEDFYCDGVHEWQVWRKTAHDFMQRLFKE